MIDDGKGEVPNTLKLNGPLPAIVGDKQQDNPPILSDICSDLEVLHSISFKMFQLSKRKRTTRLCVPKKAHGTLLCSLLYLLMKAIGLKTSPGIIMLFVFVLKYIPHSRYPPPLFGTNILCSSGRFKCSGTCGTIRGIKARLINCPFSPFL